VSEGARGVIPPTGGVIPRVYFISMCMVEHAMRIQVMHMLRHTPCARIRAIGTQTLIHSAGRKPVTTDLVSWCELLICEMAVQPARWRATWSPEKEQTRDKKHTRSQAGRVEVRKHRRPRAYTTPA
jgi:hypothetical protein